MTKLRRMSEAATIERLRLAPGNRPAMVLSHSRTSKIGGVEGYGNGVELTAKRWLLQLEGAAL